jgi:uncharacterized pyridoxamine 5'-phosphate oxidase family protein
VEQHPIVLSRVYWLRIRGSQLPVQKALLLSIIVRKMVRELAHLKDREEQQWIGTKMLEFVKRNNVSFMATLAGGEPRVRAMSTAHIDEKGLTFCTGSSKDVSRQLIENPLVELCFWSTEEKQQLRIRGKMEKLDDEALKKLIVEQKFTFLKPVVEQFGWESLTLFRLESGKAVTWSSENPAESNPPIFDF